MFVMHEPMVVPNPSFGCPSFNAVMIVVRSGKAVPMAIIVAPITDPVIPKIEAILDVEFITNMEATKIPNAPIHKTNRVLYNLKNPANILKNSLGSFNLILSKIIFFFTKYK